MHFLLLLFAWLSAWLWHHDRKQHEMRFYQNRWSSTCRNHKRFHDEIHEAYASTLNMSKNLEIRGNFYNDLQSCISDTLIVTCSDLSHHRKTECSKTGKNCRSPLNQIASHRDIAEEIHKEIPVSFQNSRTPRRPCSNLRPFILLSVPRRILNICIIRRTT